MQSPLSIAKLVRDRIRAIRAGGARARRTPSRWHRRPGALGSGRVCVFVMLARGARLLPHSLDHARAWRDAGFRVVAVVVVDPLEQVVDIAPLDFADGVMVRGNRGYDFAAWAAAILDLGRDLRRCAVLAIANDSVLGPSASFAAMLRRVERSTADLVGLVESYEVCRHFQSFALFFKPGALRSRQFERFWRGVRSGDREYVIKRYELPLRDRFAAAGLRTEALFPARPDAPGNPTLLDWRALLGRGFPYLKVQLFRDNPGRVPLSDWREVAAAHGFDVPRLDDALARLEADSGSPWAWRDI